MVQSAPLTINPAGEPRIVSTTPSEPDAYTREQFIDDLKKVAVKSPKK
jgi:hypothetical protein